LVTATAKTYRVLGISLSSDGLAEFVARHNLNFPTYTGVSAEGARFYHLRVTPEVIVISPAGRVLASWRGAFVDRTKSDIEQFFSIRLPEV
jgi:hypothetical protein